MQDYHWHTLQTDWWTNAFANHSLDRRTASCFMSAWFPCCVCASEENMHAICLFQVLWKKKRKLSLSPGTRSLFYCMNCIPLIEYVTKWHNHQAMACKQHVLKLTLYSTESKQAEYFCCDFLWFEAKVSMYLVFFCALFWSTAVRAPLPFWYWQHSSYYLQLT